MVLKIYIFILNFLSYKWETVKKCRGVQNKGILKYFKRYFKIKGILKSVRIYWFLRCPSAIFSPSRKKPGHLKAIYITSVQFPRYITGNSEESQDLVNHFSVCTTSSKFLFFWNSVLSMQILTFLPLWPLPSTCHWAPPPVHSPRPHVSPGPFSRLPLKVAGDTGAPKTRTEGVGTKPWRQCGFLGWGLGGGQGSWSVLCHLQAPALPPLACRGGWRCPSLPGPWEAGLGEASADWPPTFLPKTHPKVSPVPDSHVRAFTRDAWNLPGFWISTHFKFWY